MWPIVSKTRALRGLAARLRPALPLFPLFALALMLPARAAAHPHVYVDVSLTFVVDEAGLSELRQHWLFDDMFTRAIMADLGLDENRLATPAGQQAIREGAFNYLANYGYFTLIESAGRRIRPAVTAFRASLTDGRLVYDFTMSLGLGFDQVRNFRAAIFDPEYYTDILLLRDAITFEVGGTAQISHAVHPAKDHTYWYYIVPEAVHLSLSGTPDSEIEPILAPLEASGPPGPLKWIMGHVRAIQKELNIRLNGFATDIKDDPLGPALWTFLALSFLYGVVHAVGPGHGKTVVCSYFLSNPGSFLSGAIMGNAITFVHMASAAVAVGAAYLLFSTGMGGFQAASRALQPASYALLALMGLFLTAKALLDLSRGGLVAETSCHIDHQALGESVNTRRVLLVSFVTGLIPCPGAAVILAFSIGLNIFWAGLAAVIVMAAGMGLTTTLFAWAAVAARGLTLRMSGKNARLFNIAYATLAICGAASIAILGTAMFVGSI
ncbi:DUF1007 family protein [Pseudodesulfovibrio pelocollis]|uniref:HoxN/HupN/NixA family nickel/cobalt transporter n=1 Tax=Pseudodesulfovibrio pelocollis TaxID=3051432 RepID=UPI00255A9C24|nr:DUF1007 family protein [Pseudodesulfovibrio sp. SB368]